MRINEDVLRFLTTRVDEHEEGQSAILSRRDDRRDGDDRARRPREGGFDRSDRGPRRPRVQEGE